MVNTTGPGIGLGVFDTGELTDGILADGATDSSQPSDVLTLSQLVPGSSNLFEIVFDLEGVVPVDTVTIGTSVRGDNGIFGGWAPTSIEFLDRMCEALGHVPDTRNQSAHDRHLCLY